MIPISILDQLTISEGSSPKKTLEDSIKVAQLVEEMGYKRYWISEHHGNRFTAHSSPEILMATIAAHTKEIKIGSGGILLQHYSPYKIAESIKLLSTLYPHRIDGGIGRADGGSKKAVQALKNGADSYDYKNKIKDLITFLENDYITIDNEKLYTSPIETNTSEIWLLGSSENSAQIAAEQSTNFAFAHFISPEDNGKSTNIYIEKYKGKNNTKPYIALCVGVICAETIEKSEELARNLDYFTIKIEREKNPPNFPNPNLNEKIVYSADENKIIEDFRKGLIVGTPEIIRKELERLIEIYNADELILLTTTYSLEDKINSYKLMINEMKK